MKGRTGLGLQAAAATLAAVLAAPALAAGPGLPRTYDVVRYDSPVPGQGGQYPLGIANAGDLNGDGKQDFLTSQLVNTRNDAGQISNAGNGAVYVINGATGARIATLEAPDPGGRVNAANFAFPWVSRLGFNGGPSFSDLGSCSTPAVKVGDVCRSAVVGPPDGVPEILVGARGVDARDLTDSGRSYVIDGASFSILKRIDQPASDTTPVALSRAGGSWFGRTVLNPSGLPACERNAGVGGCDTIGHRSAIGDLDGGGSPDIVVGASATTENTASAYPTSHCARTPNALCGAAGRVYIYRGEDIVGTSPAEILDGTVPAGGAPERVTTIRNIHAQADDPMNPVNGDSELFGNSLTPVGDVGACRAIAATPTAPAVPVPPAGDPCPRANSTTTPDGSPEFVIGALRVDLPVDGPNPSLADAGTAYLVDGTSNTILATYRHPEPHLGALFGAMVTGGHATGDLGDTGLPDFFIPAPAQNIPGVTAAGRGYVLNGNFRAGVSNVNFARVNDPTPAIAGNFAYAQAGVGDLVPGSGAPANELLLGGTAGFFGAGPRDRLLGDVQVFNAASEKMLQNIPDPDAQAGSQFGAQIVTLGDVNGDTFLDFAVAAPLFDGPAGTDQGRVYVFTSDNTPLPAATPTQTAAPAASPAATPAPTAAPSPVALLTGRCANERLGSEADDELTGTMAGDSIFTFGGDDEVDGLAGEDCADGGRGDDRLDGGDGNDSLLGKAGKDDLDGGAGNDRLFGEEGNDLLRAGAGRDMLAGGDGRDRLLGDDARARLFGERGNDRLVAGTGGRNTLDGGPGRDSIDAVNGERDRVNCGSGRDRAVVDRGDRVTGCERVRRKRA